MLAAVKDFQRTSGVRPDGVVGAGTRRILNGGQQPTTRVAGAPSGGSRSSSSTWSGGAGCRTISGDFYVTVNVPEFMLRVVKDGEEDPHRPRRRRQAAQADAVFSDEMEQVIFHPYWGVPNSIKQNEIAPYIQQGGGFFGGDTILAFSPARSPDQR